MGARWYDPQAGDFTSRDTVVVSPDPDPDPDPAAGNPFAYAADEPLDFTDPTGHYIVPPGTPETDGTTARVGSTSVTSSNNYVADVAAARVIQAAIAGATTSEAKAAAGKAAAAKVQAEQNAAASEAKKEQAQAQKAEQQKEQQQATENKANLAKVQRMEDVQLDRDAVPASSAASQKTVIPVDLGIFSTITRPAPNMGTDVETIPIFSKGGERLGTPVTNLGPLVFINPGAPDVASGPLKTPVSGQGSIINVSAVGNPGAEESCGNSFAAATPVLLASGKAVPISQLKPGDKVLADDTRTSED
jgi:hypothetical protein